MKRWVGLITLSYCLVVASGCGVQHSLPDNQQRLQQEETNTTGERSQETPTASFQPSPLRPKSSSLEISPVPSPEKKPAAQKVDKQTDRRKATTMTVQKRQKQSTEKKVSIGKARVKRLTVSQLRVKYPDTFKLNGPTNSKAIALTFDDGPDSKYTPKVLDVLKQHDVKATFFLIGSKVKKHPDIAKRIVHEGHAIGNHSYSHPLFTKIDLKRFSQEIKQTEDALQAITGFKPKLIRPPYGEIDEKQLLWAKKRGQIVINWNVDSGDWRSLEGAVVIKNILSHTKAGAIVLQHSGGADSQNLNGTVKALPVIIKKLKSEGYQFLTVPQLLHISEK